MKKVFHPPFLDVVSDKKWSSLFCLGIQSSVFLHPKSLEMAVFGCKKWVFGHLNPKTKTTFYIQLLPKIVTFYAHFWPISPEGVVQKNGYFNILWTPCILSSKIVADLKHTRTSRLSTTPPTRSNRVTSHQAAPSSSLSR